MRCFTALATAGRAAVLNNFAITDVSCRCMHLQMPRSEAITAEKSHPLHRVYYTVSDRRVFVWASWGSES